MPGGAGQTEEILAQLERDAVALASGLTSLSLVSLIGKKK